MQRERRHNPYPLTWEIPAGIACVLLLLGTLGVHLGRGLAHLTAGRGWVWPAREDLFSSLPAVLAEASGPLAVSLQGWIVTVELLLLSALAWATASLLRRWGPGRLKGMATPQQAEQILGVRRLRRVAPVVRPDLHARRAAR